MIYLYSENDFVCHTSWDNATELSEFDKALQSRWQEALDKGYFRYNLNIISSKLLAGKFSFLCQLNPDRSLHRRTPDTINSLAQPFDSEKFNFTNIESNEILFEIVKQNASKNGEDRDFLVINVSPLEFGHSLLLPALFKCLPQIVTVDSFQLAVEVVLLSASPALRVGFNSLCGFASVNHLHFHVYYLQHRMLLETVEVQKLSGPCFELIDYPAHAFVFQLPPDLNVAAFARTVCKLTNYLQKCNVAHNLYITRGKVLDQVPDNQDTIRVYVWARKHSSGLKQTEAFVPAVCELFGHLVVKAEAAYWSLEEAQIMEVLSDTCQETFTQIRENVKQLYL